MDRSRYRVWQIPKASGGFREILEPDPDLKRLQKSMLKWLMARRIAPSKYAHGFVKRRSTASAAAPHVNKAIVIRIDIQDFFSSIKQQQILHALLRERVDRKNAEDIAEIACCDRRLPQGSPTSPFLSNVVFKEYDYRLAGLAKAWKANYTRYADDLVFSGDDPNLNQIVHVVRKIVGEGGFQINDAKFRVYRHTRRQRVTGIVVNFHPTLPRDDRRRLRSAIHHARRDAIEGKQVDPRTLAVLEGKAAYLAGINAEQGRRAIWSIRDVKSIIRHRERLAVSQ